MRRKVLTVEVLRTLKPASGNHDTLRVYSDRSCTACAMEIANLFRRVEEEGEKLETGCELTSEDETVCPDIAHFVRQWNDSMSNQDRARIFTPDMLRQLLHTNTTAKDSTKRSWMAIDWFTRVATPHWLTLAGWHEEAKIVRGIAPIKGPASNSNAEKTIKLLAQKEHDFIPPKNDTEHYAVFDVQKEAASESATSVVELSFTEWGFPYDLAMTYAVRKAVQDSPSLVRRVKTGTAARLNASGRFRRAARSILRPTVLALQDSAADLLRRMCAVGVGNRR